MQVTFATTQSSCFTWISKPNKDADSGMMEPILEGNLSAANAKIFFLPPSHCSLVCESRIKYSSSSFYGRHQFCTGRVEPGSPFKENEVMHSPPQGDKLVKNKSYMIFNLNFTFPQLSIHHLWRLVGCVITNPLPMIIQILWLSSVAVWRSASSRLISMSHC